MKSIKRIFLFFASLAIIITPKQSIAHKIYTIFNDSQKKMQKLNQSINAPPRNTATSLSIPIQTFDYDKHPRFLQRKSVLVPCSECQKLIDKFVSTCAIYEKMGLPSSSFQTFCFSLPQTDPSFTIMDVEYCNALNLKLAKKMGVTISTMSPPNKVPGICNQFENYCQMNGGPPKCYSGFCDINAECIDCPAVALDATGNGDLSYEVCSDRGECKMAWINNYGGGNGYCECHPPFKGVACNQK